ncbi:hypothetical protein PMI22_04323 [Pseudomonas sp. GM21]|nr:hypothetical protein PMI22_04323 [Pseudomonas sp. GM21]
MHHEILPQKIRLRCRSQLSILQLHRHILEVRDHRMRHPLPFVHVQRKGADSASPPSHTRDEIGEVCLGSVKFSMTTSRSGVKSSSAVCNQRVTTRYTGNE